MHVVLQSNLLCRLSEAPYHGCGDLLRRSLARKVIGIREEISLKALRVRIDIFHQVCAPGGFVKELLLRTKARLLKSRRDVEDIRAFRYGHRYGEHIAALDAVINLDDRHGMIK